MRTLVIHPNDSTTEFLCEIYEDLDCDIIREDFENINNKLRYYDRVIMLGYGNSDGLLCKCGLININPNILHSKNGFFKNEYYEKAKIKLRNYKLNKIVN